MSKISLTKNLTTATRLKIAFIGGGVNSAVGYAHFVSSQLDGHAELVAGCFSSDPEENMNSARRYGVSTKRTYRNWKDLLSGEKDRVDAVVVLTPIPTHKEIVIQALESGYPVICEKALTTSARDGLAIEAKLKETNGFLAITYNYTGYPMVRELEHIIRHGQLGKLQHIQIEMPQQSFSLPEANPQSWRLRDYEISTVSLDLGSHVINLISFLINKLPPVELVSSQSSHGRFQGLTDNISCMIKYTNDLHVNAWWGKTALGHTNGLKIRVYGTLGSATWLQSEPEILNLADEKGTRKSLERGNPELKEASLPRYERFKGGHPAGFIEAFANLYCDIFSSLTSKVLNKYVPDSSEAIANLSCLETIEESSRTKSWQKIITPNPRLP